MTHFYDLSPFHNAQYSQYINPFDVFLLQLTQWNQYIQHNM